jgi:hypothetical protein
LRLDLLEEHLRRDPELLARTFSHREIYPPGLGCHADESLALHGTPVAGGTLLHLCVDDDEMEIARWLLERGADPNARASLRKRLRFVADESLHEYRDVTPLGWGERFHDQAFVSRPAMRLIAERGGRV